MDFGPHDPAVSEQGLSYGSPVFDPYGYLGDKAKFGVVFVSVFVSYAYHRSVPKVVIDILNHIVH